MFVKFSLAFICLGVDAYSIDVYNADVYVRVGCFDPL